MKSSFPARIPLNLTLLLSIFLLGAALRIIGMTWGLPYQLQPDEPTLFINAWERWDGVEPTLSAEYSPLYLYVLMGQREFIYRAFGPDTPQVVYFFFGRWNSILINLLVAAVAYQVGRRMAGRVAGVSFMLILALDPLAVLDQGWIIKADSFGWLLALLVLWASLVAYQKNSWRWLGLAFVLMVLATLAKYNMAFIVFAPLWVALERYWHNPAKTTLVLVLGLVLATYGAWWTLRYFWVGEIAPRFEHCAYWEGGMPPEVAARTWDFLPCGPFQAFQRYAQPFYQRSDFFSQTNREVAQHMYRELASHFGRVPFWLGLGLMAWAGWRARYSALGLLLALGILTFFLFVMISALHPLRQFYVLVLCLSAGLALALAVLWERQRWAYGLLLALLLLPNLARDIDGRRDLLKPDTRAVTADYMLHHARRGESIVVEYDWVEFGQQYGGFQGPQGYFNVIGVQGLYDLDPTRFYQDGIYYVAVDQRGTAYSTGHFGQPARLPDSFELVLDMTSDEYYGPARQLYRTFRPQTLAEARFGAVATLHGYDLTATPDGWQLQLYWHSQAAGLPTYSVFVHVLDAATGEILWQKDAPPPRSTDQWETYEWIFDRRELEIKETTQGPYRIELGLYDPLSGVRLPVNGDPLGILTLTGRLEAGAQNQ